MFGVSINSGTIHFVIMCQLTRGLGLLWCFCSSAHCFATGFLPTKPRGFAVAFR